MTRPIIWLDTETYNEVDIDVGAYVYALTAEILIVSYAIQDGPAQVWDVTSGAPAPEALISALANPDYLVYAHNSPFDRPMLEHNKIGLPVPPRERWRCTMAQALTNALPAGLDDLCRVLRVPQDQAKLAIGRKLINRFCKPAPANHKARRYDRNTHPELWAQFCEYARQDIVAMRECHRRMPDWNYRGQELDAWLLDQKINDRGFFVDKPFVDAAVRATEEEKARIAARFQELTHYQVEKPSKRDQFLSYLNDTYLLGLDNTRAETLRGLVARGDTPDELRELLEIAIESNKTSTSKYARLQQAIDPRDGRFRGGLQFAGAGRTRRWAGRIFQPQNLPSRGLPPAASVETYIEAVKVGMHTVLFDDLMKYGAAALRGAVLASPGKAIRAADLSNIEGRMLAWFAGEEWKLKAFRDYDAGVGPDLYNITANMIIGVDPWEVPKKLRNVFGKVPDLASGYQGGVSGYQQFARAYGVKMADHWDTICQSIDEEIRAAARKNLGKDWAKQQVEELGISELEWLASETCKIAWRRRHPATVKFWYDLQDAVKQAIQQPGQVFVVTKLKVSVRVERGFRWLLILLPSGNRLCYFEPGLTEDGSIFYWGMSEDEGSTTKVWTRVFTHGGKLTGNVCQTTARDLLTYNMPSIEGAGYDILMTVHDEVVTESPIDSPLDDERLARLMSWNPPWAPDIPLAADGFSAPRYKKED